MTANIADETQFKTRAKGTDCSAILTANFTITSSAYPLDMINGCL